MGTYPPQRFGVLCAGRCSLAAAQHDIFASRWFSTSFYHWPSSNLGPRWLCWSKSVSTRGSRTLLGLLTTVWAGVCTVTSQVTWTGRGSEETETYKRGTCVWWFPPLVACWRSSWIFDLLDHQRRFRDDFSTRRAEASLSVTLSQKAHRLHVALSACEKHDTKEKQV